MVGALSIVRFRTAIKDPTDLIFLFWAVVAGIVTGAGFFTLSLISTFVTGFILFFFIKKTSIETPYLLVVNCDGLVTMMCLTTASINLTDNSSIISEVTSDRTTKVSALSSQSISFVEEDYYTDWTKESPNYIELRLSAVFRYK